MLELFHEILRLSLTGSLIALAVICIRPILRKAPKWTLCLLWGLVALRLICPISPESTLSLVPNRIATGQIISNVANIPVQDAPPDSDSNLGIDRVPEGWEQQIPSIGESFYYTVPLQSSPTVGEKVFPALSWIWVIGVGLMLSYSALSYILLRKRMEEATHLQDNIWQCEAVESPFVLGFLRPRIYLPYQISDSDMESVIAHERAHIHRKDHWWKPLGFLLLSVHWFNPVLWLSYVLLCRDIEAACDERVIRNMEKAEKQAYSTALLHCSIHRNAITACPLAFGEVSVKERVKNVMHYRKPAFWVILIAVVVCIVVAVCFLTNPPLPSLEVLPLVHSHGYGVVEVTYEANNLETTMVAQENTSVYAITEDMQFMMQNRIYLSYTKWISLGTLTETKLTRENFDELFYHEQNWMKGESASNIRRNASKIWELILPEREVFFYLIQMKNGELFLAEGYYDTTEKDDPGSDDTAIHRLYRIAVDLNEEFNILAKSGENVVPLSIFPSGTAIANYKNAIQWLTIAPGEDYAPFRTYRNGEELYAIYNVFDAETYEPLPHMIPSGLEPQTGLFQNADPDREYIVIMMLSYEPNAEIYCFGVRFGEDSNSPADPPVAMVPTDSALEGIFDCYLYMTIDGVKYRYERQETMPGGIQADAKVAIVYEDSGLGDRYSYTVFSVKDCSDNSMFLVHSGDMDMMWLYQYSPAKASAPVELQNAINSGFAVMENGYATHGQQAWHEFYQKTRQGIPASISLASWYTLNPVRCSAQYYEAYREDYPLLYLQELSYDGEVYTIRSISNPEEPIQSYEYLMCFVDEILLHAGSELDSTFIRYVLTHDNGVTWKQLWKGLVSSQLGAYIDHYQVYTEKA